MASAKPCPRSPPTRRSKIPAEAQISDREIGFLKERTDGQFQCEQEELQSLEGLPSAHRCCKEVHEFVGSNPDPLIPPNKKKQKSCRTWEWLRKTSFTHSLKNIQQFIPFASVDNLTLDFIANTVWKNSTVPAAVIPTNLCCNFLWMCCSCTCSLQLQTLCCPNRRNNPNPETCCCCSFRGISCCRPTQRLQPGLPCPGCSCGCACSCCPDCIEVRLCPKCCTKTCCSERCLC